MITSIREVEAGLGNTVRTFCDKEINQRRVHRTSIVIKKRINKGDILNEDNLTVKRPGTGIKPKFINDIIGKKCKHDLDIETLLSWNDIEL